MPKKTTEQVRTDRNRHPAILAVVALAAGGFCLPIATASLAEDRAPEFMFVHTADGFVADTEAKTFRLVNVSQQVLYFSDRPDRIAGHLTMQNYLDEWTEVEDNFNDDPPNAALSVYEPGESNNSIAVVEITMPTIEGNDIVYHYDVLDGSIPANGEETALFIDKIGLGGGVGVGYHGVGVGVRGPGVTGWAK